MKKYLLLFVSFFFLFPLGVGAVDLKKSYEEDLKECYFMVPYVLPSYDNAGNFDGYFFYALDYNVGDTVLSRFDLNNKFVNKKTSKEFEEKNLDIQVEDSENISEKLSVIKYDDNNKVVFETKWGGTGYDVHYDILNLKSFNDKGEHDGYITLFHSKSFDLNVEPGMIWVKFDLKGNLIWQKNVNGLFYGERNGYFPNYSDKNNIFTIAVDYNYIEKTVEDFSTNRETVWHKETNMHNINSNYSYTKSGELDGTVVVGFNDSGKGTIIKYDLDGNEVFRNSYDSDIKSYYTDVISSRYIDGTYDGYIVVATLTDGKSLIIKYDYSGKMLWKEEFSSNTKNPLFSIRKNYDNSGKQNGYLFLPTGYENENEDEFGKTCEYTLFKYTYPNYEIKKDITDEGDITVSDSAYPGDTVKVKVTPKEGYVLKRIVVLDESGKEVEVSDDGTFVMPEGKVTVAAIYNRISNPETVSVCYVVLGIILLISIGTLIVQKKRQDV